MTPSSRAPLRPHVRGKFVFVGGEKFYARGVTYGAFQPDDEGSEFHDLGRVESDFAQMAANGINSVRVPHTTPPVTLLDAAEEHGLRVMVGLSAEQYLGYLIDGGGPDIEQEIRAKVRTVAGHPALLCYGLGNEIPASIARWLGRKKVESYLGEMCRAVREEDPEGLVTYVNYPSTEYLELPFLDLVCFNLYLEQQERFEAYLARLHNLAGDRPVVMSEIGLDSLRNGEDEQARSVEWQIRTTFESGCAGAFVFSWTDEWHRAGAEVEDWAFGLTDKQRRPKPALDRAQAAFSEVPFPAETDWPRVSVVICCYNGEEFLSDCLDGVGRLEYPNFEVIVVDDGSTDATARIAQKYDFNLISTENRGLGSARNTGMAAATGEIVAYLDGDARPDPHWLHYLAATFLTTQHVGVGGPNVAPPKDGSIAECVANSPGGPVHVLLTDREAEHIPGCNMAFRKAALEKIGGFDSRFRVAGDDVDICWRMHQEGWTVGFSPSALVWHHSRNSIRTYWKQQKGYGRAEALLESKWPEKYNHVGHLAWSGRIYGRGLTIPMGRVRHIYHGVWGQAPFQFGHDAPPSTLKSLPLMPEWWLLIAGLAGMSALGLMWSPMLLFLPFLALAFGVACLQAGSGAARAWSLSPSPPSPRLRAATAFLHFIQPIARLVGRLGHGLSPWRRLRGMGLAVPRRREVAVWSGDFQDVSVRLESIESSLKEAGATVVRGGDYDSWDLEVRGGAFGSVRVLMAVEDHGAGTQYVRLRSWPRSSWIARALVSLFVTLVLGTALAQNWVEAAVLGGVAALIAARMVVEAGSATRAVLVTFDRTNPEES
ncbi:MAG: glycosyltransferase [Actinomycetota bacterium]